MSVMAKMLETAVGNGEFTCESCGALYSVSVEQTPVQDRSAAHCEVCGRIMADWQSGHRVVFVLKERPGPDRDDTRDDVDGQ
jgi:transcription elongation factor Elf1